MANQWLRLWHDMPNDPKWRTVAKLSKQPISTVIASYVHLLVMASLSEERGTVNVNPEDLASALDTPVENIQAILQAMQGRVLRENKLMGWDKRQPLKEDGSAERAKAWREAKKQSAIQTNASKQQDKDTDTEINTLSVTSQPALTTEKMAMTETWQPTAHFQEHLQRMGIQLIEPIPEDILKEFICFWLTKPDITKTQEQWHHALAQSYQYAINREKIHEKAKRFNRAAARGIEETATDISWLYGF